MKTSVWAWVMCGLALHASAETLPPVFNSSISSGSGSHAGKPNRPLSRPTAPTATPSSTATASCAAILSVLPCLSQPDRGGATTNGACGDREFACGGSHATRLPLQRLRHRGLSRSWLEQTGIASALGFDCGTVLFVRFKKLANQKHCAAMMSSHTAAACKH